MEKAKFTVHKNQLYWFRIKSPNGRILATSETYRRKASCYKAIRAIAYPMAPVIIDFTGIDFKTQKHDSSKRKVHRNNLLQ